MSLQSPRYSYAIAFGLGIIAFIWIDWFTFIENIFKNAGIYISLGIVVGLLWPKDSWKWGLWISAPFWFVIGLSLLFTGFSGDMSIFFQNDFPPLMIVLLSSCLGGLVGSLLIRKIKTERNSIAQ